MLTPRICVMLTAIASIAATLPAIALPTTTTPTKTPPATLPKPKPAAVTSITVADVSGVYKAIFDPKLLQALPADEQKDLEQQKVMLDSIRLTVKPDSSFELVSRKSPADTKTTTIAGKVKVEGNKVSLSVVNVDGRVIGPEESGFPPAVFTLLEGGKVWELPDRPLVKLVKQ
jgi:hypothetical protein